MRVQYKLFNSYLENRKEIFNINAIFSDMKVIKCGVPQRTVLGLLLFDMYLNLSFKGEDNSLVDNTSIFINIIGTNIQDFYKCSNFFDYKDTYYKL